MSTATDAWDHGRSTMDIARRLRGVIGEAGVNQTRVGLAMGRDRNYMNRIALGKSELSSPDLTEIGRLLNINPLYLLGIDPIKRPFPGQEDRPPCDPDPSITVRHQGLEPRTRWFGVTADRWLSLVPDLDDRDSDWVMDVLAE